MVDLLTDRIVRQEVAENTCVSWVKEVQEVACSSDNLKDVINDVAVLIKKRTGADVSGIVLYRNRYSGSSYQVIKGLRKKDIDNLRTLNNKIDPETVRGFIKQHASQILIEKLACDNREYGLIFIGKKNARRFAYNEDFYMESVAAILSCTIDYSRRLRQNRDLAVVRERERIATEIHDGITQSLYSLSLQLKVCQKLFKREPDTVKAKLPKLEELTNESINEVRHHIFRLRENKFKVLGLADVLDEYTRQYCTLNGLDPEYEVYGEEVHLSSEAKEILYDIVRECLANVVKHADAKKVLLKLEFDDTEIDLSVEDDGKGFDVGEKLQDCMHLYCMGLANIEKRVNELDGTLNILSSPGKGTRIAVSIPYSESVIEGYAE